MATEEFCQHTEKGKRCVAGYNHTKDKHDLQPMGSITVQTIDRQDWMRPKPPVTIEIPAELEEIANKKKE